MKNISIKWTLLFCVAFIGSLLCSCKDDDKTKPNDGKVVVELSVDPTELGFKQEGGRDVLKITSNSKWTAAPSVNWCQLSKMAGAGNDSLGIIVEANPSTVERRGQVVVNAGGENKVTVTIVQFGVEPTVAMFVDGKAMPTKAVKVSNEYYRYNLTVLSNYPFDVKRLGEEEFFSWTLDNTVSSYDTEYRKAYKFSVADNEEKKDRYVSLLVEEIGGKNTDTLYIQQEANGDFLRFWQDTVYAGSHYNLVEIPCRANNVVWTYEFVGEKPSWLSNPRTKNSGEFAYLGKIGSLIFDIEKNTDLTKRRSCEIKFKYTANEKEQEKIVKIVQLPYHSVTSDSLVLMDIASMNTEKYAGLNLGWIEGYPVTAWANLKWGKVGGETRLQDLNMSGGWLVYELTASIGNLTELTGLNIAKNFLEGALPKEIGRLTKLKNLQLNDNYNTNLAETPAARPSGLTEIPKEIFEGCRDLESLVLSTNSFTSIPEELGLLTKLKNLEMGGLYELKTVPFEVLKNMPSLTSFYFSNLPKYEGGFPEVVFEMPWLKEITLMMIPFKCPIVDRFNELPNLKTLVLFNCGFTGELPTSIVECKSLYNVQFGKNKLTGVLPEVYGTMDSVGCLSMEENDLTGSIPDSWSNLCDYFYRTGDESIGLFINGNKLTGAIPEKMKNSPVWSNGVDGDGKKIGEWLPQQYICPQQKGYGFSNCK